MKIQLMLVDDHQMTLEVLKTLLESHSDIEVVGAARSGEEALTMARVVRPDVVLMDLVLPGMDGVDATRAILAELPSTRVTFLSMYCDPEQIARARGAGAAGYLLKSESVRRLVPCIRAIVAGELKSDFFFVSNN